MQTDYQAKLEKWGLDPLDAQVYLALVRSGQSVGASALATAAGIPRPSVYPVLKSLVERGMVENGEGYGSQFAALPPDEAFPRLIAAEKENLAERESLTRELIEGLRAAQKKGGTTGVESKLVEVLRDPRVFSVRLQNLQREAKHEINVIVKQPLILKDVNARGNPDEVESLRRGVRHRVLYEEAVFGDENLARFLKGWVEAGEEARVYKGILPLKFLLFDAQIAWMPLDTNAKHHPIVSVLIRHHALGQALRLLFDFLWNLSEPITSGGKKARRRAPNKGGKSKK